ncbi:MAG: hypothetical protein GF398_09825 [Chitinivibrionales bacterium]|nr:hypothetical protein [Chitinivibrionales bacterium]
MKSALCLLNIAIIIGLCTASAMKPLDHVLLTISLNEDSTSIMHCSRNRAIRDMLAGPVLAKDDNLLFYSSFGYILYDQNGELVDSHTVFEKSKKPAAEDPARLKLAFPLDGETMLYTRKKGNEVEIFQKKYGRKRLKKVREEQLQKLDDLTSTQIYNIAYNAITSEMVERQYLHPGLVGFTDLMAGKNWWSIDKRFSFTTPLLLEEKQKYSGFFPGIVTKGIRIKKYLIEPLCVIKREATWYYYGLQATTGSDRPAYYQYLYVCDNAGNLLGVDTLLKQKIGEVVLEKHAGKEYTFDRTTQWVFPPTVDGYGNVYYGLKDFEKKTLEVHKRSYSYYKPLPCGAQEERRFAYEKNITYELVRLDCNPRRAGGKAIPKVWKTDSGGTRNELTAWDLTRKNYLVRLFRPVYQDVNRKTSRINKVFPAPVQNLQNSLSKMSTSWCPYSISLSHSRRGIQCSFDYSVEDQILCARVINASSAREVFVRIDLQDRAEMLVFSDKGDFINRFTFSRQSYQKRRDLIVVADNGKIIEKDFEVDDGGYRYQTWVPVLHSSGEATAESTL